MPRFLVFAALLMASPMLCLSGNAAAASGPQEIRVNIADVDASTWPGAKEILRRVRVAARQVCSVKDDALVSRSDDDECVDEVVAQAVYRTRLPRLTRIYVNETGRLPRGP